MKTIKRTEVMLSPGRTDKQTDGQTTAKHVTWPIGKPHNKTDSKGRSLSDSRTCRRL